MEKKRKERGKEEVFGVIRNSRLSLLIGLIMLAFLSGGVFAAEIWTTDSNGEAKLDYSPNSIVYIHGSGFELNSFVLVKVTWPDGKGYFVGAHSNSEGNFVLKYPLINGIEGKYPLLATDGKNLARGFFTDSVLNSISVRLNGGDAFTQPSPSTNGESITVGANETIEINVTVTTSGVGTENDWKSVAYNFVGLTFPNFICIDTPDHLESGTNSEVFNVTGPGISGTYDLNIMTFRDDACKSSPVLIPTFNAKDSVIVNAPPICGDGIVNDPSEECDDGNSRPGDSCDQFCKIEPGLNCSGVPNSCADPNPDLNGETCGVDLMLVIDVSGSIDSNELNTQKQAFNLFVDSILPKTPSEIGVVEFESNANLIQNYSNNATEVKNSINSALGGGNTNWQDALIKAHSNFDNRNDKPDIYIFASDGNPNTINYDGWSTGNIFASDNRTALGYAIEEANKIKGDGVKIITLGIGDILKPENLIAISSPDSYYETDFDTLADTLMNISKELCGGTVTVKKNVDGVATANWTFEAVNSHDVSGVTDENGLVNLRINITGGSEYFNLSEELKSGFEIENASCVMEDENVGNFNGEFVQDILISETDMIYCEFNNTLREPSCGDGILDSGEECDDGNNINGDGCSAQCILEVCGDGIVDAGEECDDGNNNNFDSCRNDCTAPMCGDGVVDYGEECDDGNDNNFDSCNNQCEAVCIDNDQDCVCDDVDLCLDSRTGEPVDVNGCDPFQFCGTIACGPSCEELDFVPVLLNCEPYEEDPNAPAKDCTTVIVPVEGEYYPSCVPVDKNSCVV